MDLNRREAPNAKGLRRAHQPDAAEERELANAEMCEAQKSNEVRERWHAREPRWSWTLKFWGVSAVEGYRWMVPPAAGRETWRSMVT